MQIVSSYFTSIVKSMAKFLIKSIFIRIKDSSFPCLLGVQEGILLKCFAYIFLYSHFIKKLTFIDYLADHSFYAFQTRGYSRYAQIAHF